MAVISPAIDELSLVRGLQVVDAGEGMGRAHGLLVEQRNKHSESCRRRASGVVDGSRDPLLAVGV